MSQKDVERVIGRLVTDEMLRRRFAEDPQKTLEELVCCDAHLSSIELSALASIDPRLIDSFADAIDPRIQKADVCGGGS